MFSFGRYSVSAKSQMLEVSVDQRDVPIWPERKWSSVNREGVYRPWFSRGCISDES